MAGILSLCIIILVEVLLNLLNVFIVVYTDQSFFYHVRFIFYQRVAYFLLLSHKDDQAVCSNSHP